MRARNLAVLAAASMLGVSVTASARPRIPHLPPRPSTASLLAAAPVAPNGLLIRENGRLRTLELDELAPLRLRLSIPF